MPSKTPALKAIEKQIKEEQKHVQEAARRDRAKAVVDSAKHIGSFRLMNNEAEIVLQFALNTLSCTEEYRVSVPKDRFSSNIRDNFALVCEELQQYGVITAYVLYGQVAILTLSEAGKTYFVDKELAEKEQMNVEASIIQSTKRDKIFISHRSLDAPIADMIKDFLVNTGIPNEKVFCSSLPGNDVKEKIAIEVKQRLQESIINILILSKDYYQSAYCLNEAGVAWYLDEAVAIPIGLPEIDHSNMIGFLDGDYKLRRLDNDDDISYLYDTTQEKLNASNVKHSIITRETVKLKERYAQFIVGRCGEHNAKASESNEKVQSTILGKDESVLLVYAAETDGVIIVSQSVTRSGPSIEAGGYDFASIDTPRECARWKAAVDKLEEYKLIECPKNNGETYKVTDSGYKVSDQEKEMWLIDVSKSPNEYV